MREAVIAYTLVLSAAAGLTPNLRAAQEGPGGVSAAAGSSNEAFVKGKQKLEEQEYGEAAELLARAADQAGRGRAAAEALFLQGEALRRLGQPEEALACYDEVLRLQPRVEILERALDRKYQLGLDFLQGNAKRYFLGIIPYSSSVFGVKILDELVRQFPFKDFSDDALLNIANYYFRDDQLEEARPWYERLIESYPESEWVPPAYFQLGKTIFFGIKGYQYDPAPLMKARWHFERFLEKRPIGLEAEQAKAYIRELREMEARHELTVARYYLRNDCVKGAVIHFEAAVKRGTGPDGQLTSAAREAQEGLNRLDALREARE